MPDNTLCQDQPGRPWVDQHRKWRNSTDCWDRREVHVLGQQPCGNTRPGRNQNGGYHSNISCSCSYSRSLRDWVDVRQGLYSCDLSNKSIKRLIFISANPRTIPGEGRVECLRYLNVNLISLRVIRAFAPVKVRACLILKLTKTEWLHFFFRNINRMRSWLFRRFSSANLCQELSFPLQLWYT